MIDHDAPLKQQTKQWLDECYNTNSMMSSTEKLTHAYRLISIFQETLEEMPNERTGEV